jgi:glutathionylspermidine synthase
MLCRLARRMLTGDRPTLGVPRFPVLAQVQAAGPLDGPFFWGRFDVFERADGGLAVLEYNCDKPVGQREIWASAEARPAGTDPNHGARIAFRRALARAWATHRRPATAGDRRARPARLVVLVDPTHAEELRLAYLFGREAARLGWRWDVVGPDNLRVEGGWPTAYGERVDVVLRQYPTEFLHELPAMPELWAATRRGRLLWLNDPRAVLAQAKSSLAVLWSAAIERRGLGAADAALVKRYLPPTALASTPGWLERARARREDWVIKPVLGRYSEAVALGPECSAGEWELAVDRAAASAADFVLQAYVPPRRRWLPAPGGDRPGYVNWGVYLAGGRPAGLCPRLQPTPLTAEETTWWAPLRLARPRRPAPRSIVPRRLIRTSRRPAWPAAGAMWQRIADGAALTGYTNVWTDGLANFTLSAIGLGARDWDEVAEATRRLGGAVGRVLAHLAGRPELLDVLGIPAPLAPFVSSRAGDHPWSFLSRFDWALTTRGRWQLLEINSDTPAGLWEAAVVAAEVARLHRAPPVSEGRFWPAVAASWRGWVERALGAGALEREVVIALAGAVSVPEDLDQLRAHARAVRLALPKARVEIGALADLVLRDGRAWLQGAAVDLVFRYYPLDWLADGELAPLLDAAASGDVSMLPPAHCLIPQSKAFLALVWELCRQGFFPAAEAAAIREYVPLTALDPRRLGRRPYVVKPYLEREGHGVRFGSELGPAERRRLGAADVVYQERLALTRLRLPVATAAGWREETRFLVFGVFLAGDAIAGVYTRAGAPVTGREAVFTPVVEIPRAHKMSWQP